MVRQSPANVVNGVNRGCDYNLDAGGGSVGPPQGGYYDHPNAPVTPIATTFSQSDFINGLFSPSIFPVPTPGQNGTLGRNTFRGPHYMGFDASMGRTFPIVRERVSLQVRAEAFNILNKTNLYLPNTDLSLALKSDGTYSTTRGSENPHRSLRSAYRSSSAPGSHFKEYIDSLQDGHNSFIAARPPTCSVCLLSPVAAMAAVAGEARPLSPQSLHSSNRQRAHKGERPGAGSAHPKPRSKLFHRHR